MPYTWGFYVIAYFINSDIYIKSFMVTFGGRYIALEPHSRCI